MKQVLFVCVHNSGRSQMAEALFNRMAPEGMRAVSAGTKTGGSLNPAAVEAMKEMGVDLVADGHHPKVMTPEMVEASVRVITMGCDVDASACPANYYATEDWGLDDPKGLPLAEVREIREQIRGRVEALVAELASAAKHGSATDRITRLRELLATCETLVMPDAYDSLSARIIESTGFEAIQCSGYSFALAAGCPSEPALGFERNLAVTREIVNAVRVPVMADGEDGFGDPPVVANTVRAFAQAGVAGINLEDQVLGTAGPRSVISASHMVEKLHAAREAADAAGASGLLINARTDALTAAPDRHVGIEEAIARANLYLDSGGDLAFVVGAASLEEVRTLVAGIHGPVSIAAGMPYNIGSFSVADLRACGVARVSLPALAVFCAVRAMTRIFSSVRDTDGFAQISEENLLCTPQEAQRLSYASEGDRS